MLSCQQPTSATFALQVEGEPGHLGVCYVDASICEFFIGCFVDDVSRSQLALLMCHVDPVELIHARLCMHGAGLHQDTHAAIKVRCAT